MQQGLDPTTQSIGRCMLWIEGRQNKEGVIEDPATKEVVEKIEVYSIS